MISCLHLKTKRTFEDLLLLAVKNLCQTLLKLLFSAVDSSACGAAAGTKQTKHKTLDV